MTNERDKPQPFKPDDAPGEPELPFATPQDHAEFFNIIRQLEVGTLSPEKARIRVLMLYDTSLGAWVRALGRSHPEIASGVTKGLLQDLEQVAQNLAAQPNISGPSPTPAKPDRQRTPRLTAKTVEVLERERLILDALLRANEALTLAELRKVTAEAEPDIEVAALTANLDRLDRDGFIHRPRKGYYAGNAATRPYVTALKTEIDARGSKKR